MTPVALKTAQKTGYPAEHIIGNTGAIPRRT